MKKNFNITIIALTLSFLASATETTTTEPVATYSENKTSATEVARTPAEKTEQKDDQASLQSERITYERGVQKN